MSTQQGTRPPQHRESLVSDVMSKNVIHVNVDDSVAFVANLFDRCHISGAPVVGENGSYVGVVSRTDISGRKVMSWLESGSRLEQLRTREIMTVAPLCTVEASASVQHAVRLMLDNHVHRLFVLDGHGKITGVISSFDVLKVIQLGDDCAPPPIAQVAPQVVAAKAEPSKQPAPKAVEEAAAPESEEDRRRKSQELEDRITKLILKKQQEIAGTATAAPEAAKSEA